MQNSKYIRLSLLAAAMFTGVFSIPVYAEKMSNQPAESPARSGSQNSAFSSKEQNMLRTLAQGNMAEIASAELAQTKSSNQDVLIFAKRMIDDHSDALKEIAALAKDKGIELPKATDAKHAEALKKMNTLSKAEFDRQYLAKVGVDDHGKMLKLLKDIESNAKDSDFKMLAKKLETGVLAHLDMAKSMHKK